MKYTDLLVRRNDQVKYVRFDELDVGDYFEMESGIYQKIQDEEDYHYGLLLCTGKCKVVKNSQVVKPISNVVVDIGKVVEE